jgi:hypothetical protein
MKQMHHFKAAWVFCAALFLGGLAPLSYADGQKLQRAINLLETSPTEALKQLAVLPEPSAKAFQAYALFTQTGPSARVDRLMRKAIAGVNDTYGLGDIELGKAYHYDTLQLLLNHLRFIAGTEEGDQLNIPCFILERYPLEAYRAFDAYWGSNRDSFPAVCQEKDFNLPKFNELQRYVDLYRQFNRELQGSSVTAKHLRQGMYYNKAVFTPQYTLSEVGLDHDAITLAQARKAMPNAKWLNYVERRLNVATRELLALHKVKYPNVPETILHQNTYEALEAYVSYQLIRGEVTQP